VSTPAIVSLVFLILLPFAAWAAAAWIYQSPHR
jgi:hypothetical protein